MIYVSAAHLEYKITEKIVIIYGSKQPFDYLKYR